MGGEPNTYTDADVDGIVAQMFARIAELDRMFEGALAWGSWMVEAANEREGLVNQLRAKGHDVEHRFQARCGDKHTD